MTSGDLQQLAAAADVISRDLTNYDPPGVMMHWPIGPTVATNLEIQRLGGEVKTLADMIRDLAGHLASGTP